MRIRLSNSKNDDDSCVTYIDDVVSVDASLWAGGIQYIQHKVCKGNAIGLIAYDPSKLLFKHNQDTYHFCEFLG